MDRGNFDICDNTNMTKILELIESNTLSKDDQIWETISEGAAIGDVPLILDKILEKKGIISQCCSILAVRSESLSVLEWLYRKGLFQEITLRDAVLMRKTSVLIWAENKGFRINYNFDTRLFA